MRPKLSNLQVAYAGEHFVAAEIHRRGGYAVEFRFQTTSGGKAAAK